MPPHTHAQNLEDEFHWCLVTIKDHMDVSNDATYSACLLFTTCLSRFNRSRVLHGGGSVHGFWVRSSKALQWISRRMCVAVDCNSLPATTELSATQTSMLLQALLQRFNDPAEAVCLAAHVSRLSILLRGAANVCDRSMKPVPEI